MYDRRQRGAAPDTRGGIHEDAGEQVAGPDLVTPVRDATAGVKRPTVQELAGARGALAIALKGFFCADVDVEVGGEKCPCGNGVTHAAEAAGAKEDEVFGGAERREVGYAGLVE